MKKAVIVLLVICLMTACFAGCKKGEESAVLEIPEITYEVPEWYRDAKFGIFIHYGVYSVPAFGDEWYGHWMYIPNSSSYGNSDIYIHHRETYGGAEKMGYKDFIPEFQKGIAEWQKNNGAEKWAQLFEQAGAKYVVPVGIHHDSYALYNSDIQKTYNSVSGAGVDYIGELKNAVTERGIKFGVSNHFAENDWFFDEENGKDTDLVNPEYVELYGVPGSKTKEHVEKWYSISMELINKYQPDLIYYDFDLVNDAFNRYEDASRYLMLKNYYELSKTWSGCDGVVCNYKNGAFTPDIAVLDKEREVLGSINPIPWQTDTSVGAKSWGYITNEEYRSGEEFITALIDIVSKNGNLLLNVGPKADGTFPEESVKILTTIGDWLKVYGDAIYATRPWTVYGEGETENSGDSYQYTGSDIRFTKSKDSKHLYISALGAPADGKMSVKTLNKKSWDAKTVENISLIKGSERIALEWKQTEKALEIILPYGIDGAYSVDVSFKNNGTIPALLLSGSDMIEADGETDFRLDISADRTVLLAEISGKSAGKITVCSDKKEKLCEIDIPESKSDKSRIFTTNVSVSEGINNISFDLSEGLKLERFRLCETKSADKQIEAESCDLLHGSVRAEPCADGGENLGYVGEGDFVCFAAVDFGDGKTKLTARLAGSGQSCNIRLDSPDGPVLCKAGDEDTGGWSSYRAFYYDIPETKGVHSVFITYDTGWSDLNVNWLYFSK